MAIKYQCPKCKSRYVEWGAEKLGFNCPHCEDQKLVRAGASGLLGDSAPTLKRRPKKVEKPYSEDEYGSEFEEYEEGVDNEAGSLLVAREMGVYADDDVPGTDVVTDVGADIIVDSDVTGADFGLPEDLDFETPAIDSAESFHEDED